jgi:hypothetical protein
VSRYWVAALIIASLAPPRHAGAFGEATAVEIRCVVVGASEGPHTPEAARRLAWEMRQRTSVDTELQSRAIRLDSAELFQSPFLYWRGDASFAPLSEAEIVGLRRFLQFGGFLLIDDAAPNGSDGFDSSIRRAMNRVLPASPLMPLSSGHVIYRSYYLVDRPVGRRRGPASLEAVVLEDRVAVAYGRHDFGGAWARDNLGNWLFNVAPGGDRQRELAIRFGVNVLMYALCLDYKDDQVHAPYIMRRRGGTP